MECVNCGVIGHTFRECRSPVMSFGICAVKFVAEVPHYLLVRRRDSLSYVEFLRGKYKPDRISYINLLMDNMTIEERGRLLVKSFETLWSDLWNGQNTRQFRNEFEHAKRTFEALKATGDKDGKTLAQYIENATGMFVDAEWGFPKGRRALKESETTCAIREFREETGFSEKMIQLVDEPALVEEYLGTNNIPYKQTYFVAACASNTAAAIQPHNHIMSREIGNIGWFTFEEAMGRIRESNVQKRVVMTELHRRVLAGGLRAKLLGVLEWREA
jgi:8-oxo-dGTP pyrophosphatase MutT (NUDIX family)